MVDSTYERFRADDRSYFALLKKEIRHFAAASGLGSVKLANLDIIISEMTSNLNKYGNAGELLVGVVNVREKTYLEILCIDSGIGMSDPLRMVTDGHTSSTSMGIGLGSIKRLSDYFELYSQKDWGTIILSRILLSSAVFAKTSVDHVRPLIIKMPGEVVSGDGTCYKSDSEYFYILVADGLGHGQLANLAVNEAAQAFNSSREHLPSKIIRAIDDKIRKTRGIVATVAVYHFASKKWKVAGVGNIMTKFYSYLGSKNVMSYNGIVGHTLPNTINDHEVDGAHYPQAVFCSDGIKSKWDLAKYPHILRYDLSVQTAALYKDYARHTDDMSVVIAKVI